MKRLLLAVAAAMLPLALAGGAGQPPSSPLTLGQRTYAYVCTGGQRVQATYVTTTPEKEGGPVLLVLRYGGQLYGLAQAVSASGARYVGHTSPTLPAGLEWWEKGGNATLSTFPQGRPDDTQVLLECRIVL